jgi:hypothetical protein
VPAPTLGGRKDPVAKLGGGLPLSGLGWTGAVGVGPGVEVANRVTCSPPTTCGSEATEA